MANRWEINKKQWKTLFSWAPKSLQMVTAALWKKSYDQPRQLFKKQRHYFANKCPSSQSYGFSSSHIWMWELDHKESWALKNWCFWTMVLEQTLESPLDCKGIKPVNLQGNQSWIFNGRTDAKAEAPTPWPADAKNWFTGKDPNAGKDWRQEEKGRTKDEMVRWSNTNSMDMSLSKLRELWWTGKPGALQSMGSQKVRHNWVTELNWLQLLMRSEKCQITKVSILFRSRSLSLRKR